MTRYRNNPVLGEMLVRGGRADLARMPEFELDDLELAQHKVEIHRQRLHTDPEELEARAVYRMLTKPQPAALPLPSRFERLRARTAEVGRAAWPWVKIAWALAVLALLIAAMAKAEPRLEPHNVAQPDALVKAALRSPVFAQAGGIIIQLQNQGSVLATRPAGLLVFNCGSNMTCLFSGSTFTLGASGTLGTAFNNITTGTNTGATMTLGTGATLNFTGSGVVNATQIQGVAVSGAPAAGQIPIASSGTAAAWGDPIVSGPDAPGTTPTKNPVQLGSFDGTNVQRVSSDTSGRLNVNVSNTPSVSISGALPAGSNAIGTVTANQGGSWTVTANAGAGNFNSASVGSTGSAVPGSATYAGGNGSGNLTGITVCDHWTPFSLTANLQIITGAASKQTYVCSINVVVSAADNVALVEGTGTTCGTGTAGIAGGATAATGWNFAANGGLAQGHGFGAILRTATAADNVCLLVSGTAQVSGAISWTQY